MTVRVLYFAMLRELAGRTHDDLELPAGATVNDLKETVSRRHPAVADALRRVAVAVGREYARGHDEIPNGAEVALIPPIAGGGGRLRSDPLSLDEVIDLVRSPGAGAIATFTGVVRNESRGRVVSVLEYEAYPAMAEEKLARVEALVVERWPVTRCALRHRVGRLTVGEPAVVIAVSAPHRSDAFAACAFAIDELKRTVPLWKKEGGEGGDAWVEECVPEAAPQRDP